MHVKARIKRLERATSQAFREMEVIIENGHQFIWQGNLYETETDLEMALQAKYGPRLNSSDGPLVVQVIDFTKGVNFK